MNLSSQAALYVDLVCKLDALWDEGCGETDNANKLCDECDEVWLTMSEDERNAAEVRIRQVYSAKLL